MALEVTLQKSENGGLRGQHREDAGRFRHGSRGSYQRCRDRRQERYGRLACRRRDDREGVCEVEL